MTECIIVGDVRETLAEVEPRSIQTCITSPPYFGLRDYGHEGQIGLEQTREQYVAELVAVFRLVREALSDDGTLWLNLGDSYNGSGGSGGDYSAGGLKEGQPKFPGRDVAGLKPKDLIGMPWRVAFALQADGWYLRSDIIWHKPNPMPESVTDRPTKSHEYLFLLSKSARYYYDARSIAEPSLFAGDVKRTNGNTGMDSGYDGHRTRDGFRRGVTVGETRNKRDVWTIATKPFAGSHFAVMPEALVEPCILAGSKPGDTVLDPFAGSGTVGVVAKRFARSFIGCELNPEYAQMAEQRIAGQHDTLPLVIT